MKHFASEIFSIAVFTGSLFAAPTFAADPLLDHAFEVRGVSFMPMNVETIDLAIVFDASTQAAGGMARIVFTMPGSGVPYFTSKAIPTAAKLDGMDIAIVDVITPHPRAHVRALIGTQDPGSKHVLELSYNLSADLVTYHPAGGIGFLTSMGDLDDPGNYFEAYGPSNIEADAYKLTLSLQVRNSPVAHQLFTNGQAQVIPGSVPTWRIEFPEWYLTSSFFVHLTSTPYAVRRAMIQGLNRQIPITVYSANVVAADRAVEMLPDLFKELEGTYGPFLHDSFTALIAGSGGMEHCGATITEVDALDHELTHSWFARGVMPSSGRDGWMDEAIASWRDYGYRRVAPARRGPTNLAGFSIFNPFAPYNIYRDGRTLLAELDSMFAETLGGLRPVLKKWFGISKGKAVSTEDFLSYLENESRMPISPLFNRFVYGKGRRFGGPVMTIDADFGKHPPKLTRAQILKLR